MRLFKGLGPTVLIALAGLLLTLLLSEPAAQWISRWLTPAPKPRPEVAKIVHLEGELNKISDGQIERVKAPLTGALQVRDGERLETGKDSRAIVILNSQWVV